MSHYPCHIIKPFGDRRYYDAGALRTDGPSSKIGNPFGQLFDNIFCLDIDEAVSRKCLFYARYSDDILFCCESEAALNEALALLRKMATEKLLTVSEKKLQIFKPAESVNFLGFRFYGGQVDLYDQFYEDIKRILRKKVQKILAFQKKNGFSSRAAMIHFIYTYNRYYKNLIFNLKQVDNVDSLRKVDRLVVDAIRRVGSGKSGAARFRIRYKDIQALGYKSLVYYYYNKK